MATDPRSTLLKLLDALRDLDEKRAAIYADMDALLNGGDGIGAKLKTCKAHWCEAWTTRHHEPTTFDHVKHTAALKKKLAVFTVAQVCAKMSSYIASDEPYYARARHPFPLFMTTFDTWRGTSAEQTIEASSARLREMRGQ